MPTNPRRLKENYSQSDQKPKYMTKEYSMNREYDRLGVNHSYREYLDQKQKLQQKRNTQYNTNFKNLHFDVRFCKMLCNSSHFLYFNVVLSL